MHKVYRNLLSETELLAIEQAAGAYRSNDAWDDSFSIGNSYGSISTSTSRIAKSLGISPEQIPSSIRDTIRAAAVDVQDGNYHFNEAWSIQRYLDVDGGKFDWHTDTIRFFKYFKGDENLSAEEIFRRNTVPERAISVSIALNDREEYEGGQFIIDYGDGAKWPVDLDRGDACIFTSDTFHGVEPVTKGVRDALIIWLVNYEDYVRWLELCDIATEKV
jgi:hypothetical protein